MGLNDDASPVQELRPGTSYVREIIILKSIIFHVIWYFIQWALIVTIVGSNYKTSVSLI